MNGSNLIDILQRKKYVSFDVFDTLLIRKSGNPETVFDNVEKRLINNGINVKFKKKRIEAAVRAQAKGRVEATFNEIYREIDFEDEIKAKAQLLELEEEKRDLVANGYLKNVIHSLRSNNIKIIICSDMYLTSDFITDVLKEKGFSFDYVFVSSEYQARKGNGRLFEVVLNKTGINRRDMIHIGDNFRSDFLMAKIHGIKAIHWKTDYPLNYHTKAYLKKGEKGRKIFKFLTLHSDSLNEDYRIGYELFGPVLMGFCKWINTVCEEEKIDHVCFLSRDGQIVRKAYVILYPGDYEYFLASRRSLTVPQLRNAKDFSDILKIVTYIKREEKTSDLLYKIGIDNRNTIDSIEKKYGEEVLRTELSDKKGRHLFSDIEAEMKENAVMEYKACSQYIKERVHSTKIALIDIGWYGTMQSALENISADFHISSKFMGLYFGLIKKENANDSLNAKGYVYDFHRQNMYDEQLIHGFNGLIELMFTANHGSVKRYFINNSECAECEFEESKGEYSEFVQNVQQGALKFINDAAEQLDELGHDYNIFYAALSDLLEKPKRYDCHHLGELKFFDVYFENLILCHGFITALKKPSDEIKNFSKSNWKIGYLKKLFPFMNASGMYKSMIKLKDYNKER